MNELIDSGDPRAKVVGRRRAPAPGSASIAAASQLNKLSASLRQRPFRVKHGVYRFTTHEDAEEWMMNLQVK